MRETSQMNHLQRAYTALHATPASASALTLDLAEVMSDFGGSLRRMFGFLGVAEPQRCAAAAAIDRRGRPLDVSSARDASSHQQCLASHAGRGGELAKLKALHSRLGEARLVDSPSWYEDFVRPVQQATPPPCTAGKHEFDPALSPIKDRLEAELLASDYYRRELLPLRAKMGYHVGHAGAHWTAGSDDDDDGDE